jgi:hypothetical protein
MLPEMTTGTLLQSGILRAPAADDLGILVVGSGRGNLATARLTKQVERLSSSHEG